MAAEKEFVFALLASEDDNSHEPSVHGYYDDDGGDGDGGGGDGDTTTTGNLNCISGWSVNHWTGATVSKVKYF